MSRDKFDYNKINNIVKGTHHVYVEGGVRLLSFYLYCNTFLNIINPLNLSCVLEQISNRANTFIIEGIKYRNDGLTQKESKHKYDFNKLSENIINKNPDWVFIRYSEPPFYDENFPATILLSFEQNEESFINVVLKWPIKEPHFNLRDLNEFRNHYISIIDYLVLMHNLFESKTMTMNFEVLKSLFSNQQLFTDMNLWEMLQNIDYIIEI